ncbi:Paired amphipathic helix [Corchorus olitorius]|uniref:Paired amphipathic helix n=1 Tax=Corchorus olitorius TaxID=93759 RepID=A0A1R3HDE1_9ROSI|nr:Paired amphipathic helix [Corchorus olitorius]
MEGFCQKVRVKVSSNLFDRFLQYLNCYGDGRIDAACLKNKVAELLKNYPEFVQEFLHLFYHVDTDSNSDISKGSSNNTETIDEDDDNNNNNHNNNNKETIESMFANCKISNSESDENPESDLILDEIKKKVSDFCGRVRDEFSLEEFKELLLCLLDYGDGKISKVDMKIKVNDMFPDIITDQFIEALNLIDTDTSTDQASSSSSSSDTIIINDWLDDIELTPSYNLLSKKVSEQISRRYEPGDSEVLNFCLYSKPVACCEGNKENKYENKDKLSNIEDELFEKDMYVSRIHSTQRNLKELYRVIIREGENQNPNIAEVVNSYLTATNFRAIEMIWGDHGLNMVEDLRHSPQVVLPILCQRFDQIMKENNGSCSCKDTAFDLTNLQHDCFPSHGEWSN